MGNPVAAGNTTMPTAADGSNVGATTDPSAAIMQMLMPLFTTNKSQQTVAGGTGNVDALQQLLAVLMPTTSAAGMTPQIQEIFRQGFQQQMPQILGAANTAGMRPGSATQQQLLVNDLNSRLAGQAASAVAKQQELTGQVGTAIAQNTKSPVVTSGQTKQGLNMQTALPALLLAGAAMMKKSAANEEAGGGSAATTSGGRTASVDELLGNKKKTAGSVDVTDMLLGGSNMGDIFGPSTGGINPTENNPLGGNPSMQFSQSIMAPQTGGYQGVTGNLVNQGMNYGLNELGAAIGVPYLGAIIGAADLLGVNEINRPVQDITQGIGDAASGVWNAATDAVSSIFSGCYITTAVCELEGKPDNCDELETLRSFRDNWLAKQPAGKALIKQYYEEAPRFLHAVNGAGFKEQMLKNFSASYIKPAVAAIKQGDNSRAFELYVGMLKEANQYLQHAEV